MCYKKDFLEHWFWHKERQKSKKNKKKKEPKKQITISTWRDSVKLTSANSRKLKIWDPIPSQAALLDSSQLSKQINFNVHRSYLKGESDRTSKGKYMNLIIIELI